MDDLASLLEKVLELGKARYGHRATISGKAEHGLLPGPSVVGWLQHRLQAFGSDLGRAPRHRRGSLVALLRVDTVPSTRVRRKRSDPSRRGIEREVDHLADELMEIAPDLDPVEARAMVWEETDLYQEYVA